jgi:capsular exopolysaccharide synthesis family protein
MSRIDEALRQAGRKTPSASAGDHGASLDTFPAAGAESELLAVADRPDPRVAIHESAAMPAPMDVLAERLVTHRNAGNVVIEQYRRLAGILHQAQVERGVKVVMLASAQAAEGKTLTAVNLALTLSESYKRRVLLIDADLRRPSVGKVFGLPAASGLSECLKSSELQALRITNVTDSLGLLLAGTADHDPMSGLTSGRMHEIIEHAAAGFDWVIIDTPPVGLLTDAHLLSAMVDAAILVIDAGATQHDVIQRAIQSIGREKIVGVVLNRVEQRALAEASQYKYYDDNRKRRRKFFPSKAVVANAPETAL